MKIEMQVTAPDGLSWLRTRIVWQTARALFDDWLSSQIERSDKDWREYEEALKRDDS